MQNFEQNCPHHCKCALLLVKNRKTTKFKKKYRSAIQSNVEDVLWTTYIRQLMTGKYLKVILTNM